MTWHFAAGVLVGWLVVTPISLVWWALVTAARKRRTQEDLTDEAIRRILGDPGQ